MRVKICRGCFVYEGILLEALNARDYVGSSGSANLAVYKNYSLLVSEEISVDSIDKLIKKIEYLLRLLQ
ncbi:hypothetical protein HMPREF1579_00103 [Gardnerella vaginalis JCP8066]|nr:hypothetical protein HMPREF1579_00103 [Gardnerella vaginalis JCP8066]